MAGAQKKWHRKNPNGKGEQGMCTANYYFSPAAEGVWAVVRSLFNMRWCFPF